MSRKIDGERDLLADDAEQHEHVGDHHGREQLEEVLHPEVHDPEAPELGGREVVAGAGDQADRVERGDRAGGEEEQPGHVARMLAGAACVRRTRKSITTQTKRPTVSRICQSRARSRYSNPCSPNQLRDCGVLQHAVDREVGADQRAEDDDRERAEQHEGELALALGSRRAIIGARKMPAATNEVATQKIASCTCQVRIRLYGNTCARSKPKKLDDLRAVVLRRPRRRASGSGTAPPSRRRTRRSPAAPASARRRRASGS